MTDGCSNLCVPTKYCSITENSGKGGAYLITEIGQHRIMSIGDAYHLIFQWTKVYYDKIIYFSSSALLLACRTTDRRSSISSWKAPFHTECEYGKILMSR
ncbi:hypothetical protein C5167_002899 [Papaver somniferum]|uniref:Uncharacterized protein n=1 Tax=Papaver somniferum TaxID=3469 RepID=A0A4Y7L2V6_PAPSO|nr:hypothetical protein C5167_002899 [Papaver somniferum]